MWCQSVWCAKPIASPTCHEHPWALRHVTRRSFATHSQAIIGNFGNLHPFLGSRWMTNFRWWRLWFLSWSILEPFFLGQGPPWGSAMKVHPLDEESTPGAAAPQGSPAPAPELPEPPRPSKSSKPPGQPSRLLQAPEAAGKLGGVWSTLFLGKGRGAFLWGLGDELIDGDRYLWKNFGSIPHGICLLCCWPSC